MPAGDEGSFQPVDEVGGHLVAVAFVEQLVTGVGIQLQLDVAQAGATGGKISGAGGGGFMTFYCPKNTRYKVIETLESFGGYCKNYQFTKHGLTTWTV